MTQWFNPETIEKAKRMYLNYRTEGINPYQLRGTIIRLEKMRSLGYAKLIECETDEDVENIKKTSSVIYELRFISLVLCRYEYNLGELVLCVLSDTFKKKFTQPESVEYHVITKLLPRYMRLNKVKDCSHMSFTAPQYGTKTFPYDSLWYDPKVVQDAMDLGILPSKCTVKDNFVTLMPRYLVEHNPFYVPICSAAIVENRVNDKSEYVMLTETDTYLNHSLIQGHVTIPRENMMEGIYHMEDVIKSSISRNVVTHCYSDKSNSGISNHIENVNNYEIKGTIRHDTIFVIYELLIESGTRMNLSNEGVHTHVPYLVTLDDIESYRYYKDDMLTEALPMFYDNDRLVLR